jgi:hypothetical protein
MWDLVGLTIVIAVGFLMAVWFYESLATRDVLVARVQRLARRISHRWWVPATSYLITVFLGIPILVVVWTVALEIALVFVSSSETVDTMAITSVAIVGSARLLAYGRQKTAHELAKAIPLALTFLVALEIGLRISTDAGRSIRRAWRHRHEDEHPDVDGRL